MQRLTPNAERRTANGERRTANGERRTANREPRCSTSPCTCRRRQRADVPAGTTKRRARCAAIGFLNSSSRFSR
ncbi:hypothetical protein C6T53_10365 [Burkholderia multivorans]|nr:hypothetical protein C6T53_10365 [Burkholderia multivorans]